MEKTTLREIALVFLKLGIIGFGGPAAHIAMMEEEIVRRRRWIDQQKFLDLLGAANLIPGPNSTELAIHIGYERAGWPGLIVAGVCFILPAALIVTAIAWAYVRYGTLPAAGFILYGIKPVVIAIILQALWGLAKTAVKTRVLAVIGLAVLVLSFLRLNELALLFGAGLVVAAIQIVKSRTAKASNVILPLLFQALPAGSTTFSIGAMFLFFLKVGSVLFGSGYVLLAFLRGDLVERYGWLTNEQLIDAVAVGQVTPGPVFTTATFIGYILAGGSGAVVATIGIFLPAFVFVALSGWLVPRLRESKTMGAFLDGVNAASLALMVFVMYELGRSAVIDWLTALLTIVSAVLVIKFKVNSAWLIAGGAVVGLLAGSIR
ncbi:MAG TPA: chromate efflux transporter [Pyrinomonadaceae bacterium]|nr:chromate efflux transporter [Pyrinomonadaceae bacterium]